MFTFLALVTTVGQETDMLMIVKNYVALALISSVDNMFMQTIPMTVVANA